MKAPMGSQVKQALSNIRTAKILTATIIANSNHSDIIRIKDILPEGKTLTLKRISFKNR